ncbi:LysM peptidoglycan-binding domain-containing protein [Paenibacillus sp. P26]|nr:LysM peptidoglycan-binding domain-containing protein [Paenibacillus sp. P26]
MLIHVIQSGESLWSLSRRYGVSVERIASLNELPDPNVLAVGQALLIPVPRLYTVLPGDTLWLIARRLGVTVQALLEANPIPDPYLLHPGQVLRIPEAAKPVIEVNAFSIQFDEAGAAEVREVGKDLTYLSPFGYRIKSDGSLEAVNDSPLLAAAEATRTVPILAVTNFSSTELGSNVAHAVLNGIEVQDRSLTNILNVMKAKNYKGLNIDFENVFAGRPGGVQSISAENG